MDALTRWVEDNEAEIMEQAILSAFAEGVQLRLSEWVYRVRDHGNDFDAFDDSTFLGSKFDAAFHQWLFGKVMSLKVEVTNHSIMGIVVRSQWDEHSATVVLSRGELDLSAEDKRAYHLLCEVTALRILTVWADATSEGTIKAIAMTRRGERSAELGHMHAAMRQEAQVQQEILEGLRGGKPTALTKDSA